MVSINNIDKREIDMQSIHYPDKNLETIMKRIVDSNISESNKEVLKNFQKECFTNDLSSTRVGKIPQDDKAGDSEFVSHKCIRCNNENPPEVDFCETCRFPLTQKGIIKLQQTETNILSKLLINK